jgi:hypothetical protein
MGSACAWTGNITARIAAKLAKLPWPNPMTAESVRVVFHLNQDLRLVGVVCDAVRFQALQAGLETEAASQLAKAAEDVFREAVSQLAGAEGLDVTLETFRDRLEIAVHTHGEAQPAAGLDAFLLPGGGASGFSGQELLSRVDRVLYNTEDGVASTTLVKFLRAHR